MWRHETQDIIFSLVVDEFGVNYVGKINAEHLRESLRTFYRVSEYWTGSKFLGLQLNCDSKNRHVDISMPKYFGDALHKFQHAKPKRPQDSSHPWVIPTYGARTQYAKTEDTSPVLPPKQINRIQQVIGTFLYYAIAVDVTMLAALDTLSSQQSKATDKTYTNVR